MKYKFLINFVLFFVLDLSYFTYGKCPVNKDCTCLSLNNRYESVDCSKHNLQSMPDTTENNIYIEKFSLLHNKLTTIPGNYFEKFLLIKIIDLDENEFSTIPEALKTLNKTEILWFERNKK